MGGSKLKWRETTQLYCYRGNIPQCALMVILRFTTLVKFFCLSKPISAFSWHCFFITIFPLNYFSEWAISICIFRWIVSASQPCHSQKASGNCNKVVENQFKTFNYIIYNYQSYMIEISMGVRLLVIVYIHIEKSNFIF